MLKRATTFLLLTSIEAHKILMSGSLERHGHKYFEQIALDLANNKEYDNQIYLLHHDLDDKEHFQITER